jgi:UDP-glucose 4-epimerase
METIIVTGGAGYIGSHTLIELLSRTSFKVISIDNYSNSTADTYKRVKNICGKEFEHLEVDLCNKTALFKSLENIKDIKGIIHFAAFKSVPDSMADPLLYYHNNLVSLANMLEFCREKKVNNFIFSSSCSVYGNADVQPVTEKTPLKQAESAYGHSKQVGEEMIKFFSLSQSWFKSVMLRYFNPVGAHPSGLNGELPINKPTNLLPIITQTAIGKNSLTVFGNDYDTRDGSCIRDYVHVSDIAEAHVLALQKLQSDKLKDQVSLFNLGTGNGVTVLEVIKSFEKVSGKKLPYKIGPRRAGDVITVYANNNLAKKELEWKPRYQLDDMTTSAWKWQQTLEAEKVG